jgi:hypothetical protein
MTTGCRSRSQTGRGAIDSSYGPFYLTDDGHDDGLYHNMLSLGLSFASRRFWLGNLESKLIYLDLTQMVSTDLNTSLVRLLSPTQRLVQVSTWAEQHAGCDVEQLPYPSNDHPIPIIWCPSPCTCTSTLDTLSVHDSHSGLVWASVQRHWQSPAPFWNDYEIETFIVIASSSSQATLLHNRA